MTILALSFLWKSLLQDYPRYVVQQELTLNVGFLHTQYLVLDIVLIIISLIQISKQIDAVNEVYKLHNLPEFYKVHLLFYIVLYSLIVFYCLANENRHGHLSHRVCFNFSFRIRGRIYPWSGRWVILELP